MSRFWSPFVKDLVPYVPGEQPKLDNLVKLNTNENPFGPSPKVLEAIAAVTDASLRLYPAPNADSLKCTIAEYYGVQSDQVFVGNGSDEVLAHVFHGCPWPPTSASLSKIMRSPTAALFSPTRMPRPA